MSALCVEVERLARRDEVDARNQAEAEAYAREKQEAAGPGPRATETPDVKEGEVVGA